MEHCELRNITELQFDRLVAESIKEHDWCDEVIVAFGCLREKIFGRLMTEMPEDLFLDSACEMLRIMKG